MSESIIEAQNVARSFDGKPVVRDLNLRVRRGSIYGFLGRNGAGKTTTIKMLVGLIRRDAGELRVCGADPWRCAGASGGSASWKFSEAFAGRIPLSCNCRCGLVPEGMAAGRRGAAAAAG